MKTYRVPRTDLTVSRIGCGCMNLGGGWNRRPPDKAERLRAADLVAAAIEHGITLFDHADIYTYGKSETLFGEVLRQLPGARDGLVLQSKCGIRFADDPRQGDPARYDFSYGNIVGAVEGSLRRLSTDHLDLLLLHRPDALVEPHEVARAFDELHRSGKVRHFGVSNHTAAQMALLQKHVDRPLVINQLELNLLHAHMVNDGLLANLAVGPYAAAGGILDYCRMNDVMIQAWSPVAKGHLIQPPRGADPRARQAAARVAALAKQKQTSKEAIALAWLLRHPAGIQPLTGTTDRDRLVACCRADEIELSREEWYGLLEAARGAPVP